MADDVPVPLLPTHIEETISLSLGSTPSSPLGPLGIVFPFVPKKQFTSTLI